MVYKWLNDQQGKDAVVAKIESVINYLISFVVVCTRLQMGLFFLHLIDFKFFTESNNSGRMVSLARIAVEILF